MASSHSSMWLCLQLLVVADAHAEALADDLHPIAEEIEEHGQQRADVQHDVEIERLGVPAEQPGSEIQVRGAADRQKLGEALDDGQDDHLQDGHKQPGYGIREKLGKRRGARETGGRDHPRCRERRPL